MQIPTEFKNDYKYAICINFNDSSCKLSDLKVKESSASKYGQSISDSLSIKCEACKQVTLSHKELRCIYNLHLYSNDFYKDLVNYLKAVIPNYKEE